MIKKYRSYSGFSRFHTCNRRELHSRHRKQYPPMYEMPSGLVGKVVHAVIKTMHDDPTLILENQVALEFDMQEVMLDVPVDYGKAGRDFYTGKAQRCAKWYWHWNKDIDIRSSERWFYVPVRMPDGTDEWIRGRFDQIINVDGQLVIRELKTGQVNKDTKKSLEFDLQCLIQAYALKYGYIVTSDEPYIPIDDPAYHIHDWKLFDSRDDGPDLYRCTSPGCKLTAEQFGTYPAKIIWYHIPSCEPPANCLKWTRLTAVSNPPADAEFETRTVEMKTKTKEERYWRVPMQMRADPEWIIDAPNENQVKHLLGKLVISIMQIGTCEESGIWEQTLNNSGYQSPCPNCMTRQHCESLKCCTVKHEEIEEDVDDK